VAEASSVVTTSLSHAFRAVQQQLHPAGFAIDLVIPTLDASVIVLVEAWSSLLNYRPSSLISRFY
jgi:hypothetical protein